MATLTFNNMTLDYEPQSVNLYIKENVKSFISPVGDSATQALGREARVFYCEQRCALPDSIKLYNELKVHVGKTVSELVSDVDSFPAVLTELVLTGDKQGFGRVMCFTFTEAL